MERVQLPVHVLTGTSCGPKLSTSIKGFVQCYVHAESQKKNKKQSSIGSSVNVEPSLELTTSDYNKLDLQMGRPQLPSRVIR